MNAEADNEDRTDRIAKTVVDRLPGADRVDTTVGLRVIRAGQLLAASWGAGPTTPLEQLASQVTEQTLGEAGLALRFLNDLERQDLAQLLRAVTIALGDLPGPDRSSGSNDESTRGRE